MWGTKTMRIMKDKFVIVTRLHGRMPQLLDRGCVRMHSENRFNTVSLFFFFKKEKKGKIRCEPFCQGKNILDKDRTYRDSVYFLSASFKFSGIHFYKKKKMRTAVLLIKLSCVRRAIEQDFMAHSYAGDLRTVAFSDSFLFFLFFFFYFFFFSV